MPAPPYDVIGKYLTAMDQQQRTLKDMSVDVRMEARIPKLKKYGTLNALRRISSLGKVTYKVLGFSGDDTVKKEVMARYMSAEVEAAATRSVDMAITPTNYNFKYKGLSDKQGQRVHVLELKPKSKRVGLFKGEIWLDEATCLPIREQGNFVKSPSIFIKKIAFVRDYEIRDGVAVPKTTHGKVLTRLWGSAEMRVDFSNVTPIPEPLPSPLQIVLLEELFQLPKMP